MTRWNWGGIGAILWAISLWGVLFNSWHRLPAYTACSAVALIIWTGVMLVSFGRLGRNP